MRCAWTFAADSTGITGQASEPAVYRRTSDDLAITAHALVDNTIDIGWDTPLWFDSYNGPAGPTGPADNKQDLRDFDLPFTDIDDVALGNLGGALEGPFDSVTAAGPGVADTRVRFRPPED